MEEPLISFVPDFVATTQNPSIPDHRFDGFTIPSLKNCTGDDPEEMVLCPLRAVRLYLQRTKHLRSYELGRPFLATDRVKKEVSKSNTSFWLHETI